MSRVFPLASQGFLKVPSPVEPSGHGCVGLGASALGAAVALGLGGGGVGATAAGALLAAGAGEGAGSWAQPIMVAARPAAANAFHMFVALDMAASVTALA